MTNPFQPKDFLGLPLSCLSVEEFLAALLSDRTDEGTPPPRRISYLNAHTTNLAFRDPEHRSALRSCDLVYADGMAVVWGARRLGLTLPERVNAGDFLVEFVHRAARTGRAIAFVGGRPGEVELAAERLRIDVPTFFCAYSHHGFFTKLEEEEMLKKIADSKAEIVLLGMGSPRQELVMQRWAQRPEMRGVTFWCVGALFEYYAGNRRRAPMWMRRVGLEWLVRLVLEPRRLWRRYLLGNIAFVWRILRRRPAGADSPPVRS